MRRINFFKNRVFDKAKPEIHRYVGQEAPPPTPNYNNFFDFCSEKNYQGSYDVMFLLMEQTECFEGIEWNLNLNKGISKL